MPRATRRTKGSEPLLDGLKSPKRPRQRTNPSSAPAPNPQPAAIALLINDQPIDNDLPAPAPAPALASASASPSRASSKRPAEDDVPEENQHQAKRRRSESPEPPSPRAKYVIAAKAREAIEKRLEIPTDPAGKEAYLLKHFGPSTRKFVNPTTKEVIWTGPFDESDDEEYNNVKFKGKKETPEEAAEMKLWKHDFSLARRRKYHHQKGLKEAEEAIDQVFKGTVAAPGMPAIYRRLDRNPSQSAGATPTSEKPNSFVLFKRDHIICPPLQRTQEPLILTGRKNVESVRAVIEYGIGNGLPSAERMKKLLEAAAAEDRAAAATASSTPPQTSNTQSHSTSTAPTLPHQAQADQDHSAQRSEIMTSTATTSAPSMPVCGYQEHSGSSSAEVQDYKADDEMQDIQTEFDVHQATSTTPPQTESKPERQGWFSTAKKALRAPFTFFGRNQDTVQPTTNGNETDFTFTQPHQFTNPPASPTRSNIRRPRSDRTTLHQSNQTTSGAGNRRREKKPYVPIALRGDLTEAQWAEKRREMAEYDEQQRIAMRNAQREAAAASAEESELRHKKSFKPTFQVPDASDDEDEDDDEDMEDDAAEFVNVPQYTFVPNPKKRGYDVYFRENIHDYLDRTFDRFGEEAEYKRMEGTSFSEDRPQYRLLDTPKDWGKGDEWHKVLYWNANLKNQRADKKLVQQVWDTLGEEEKAKRMRLLGKEDLSEKELKEGEVFCWKCDVIRPLHPQDRRQGSTSFHACRVCYFLLKDAHNDPDTIDLNTYRGVEDHPSEDAAYFVGKNIPSQLAGPPPKPRPSNAQLPQPSQAEAALAAANKYQPKKPSGLRNMTAASPMADQENMRDEEVADGILDDPTVDDMSQPGDVPSPPEITDEPLCDMTEPRIVGEMNEEVLDSYSAEKRRRFRGELT